LSATLDTAALNSFKSIYILSRSVIAEGVRCFEIVPAENELSLLRAIFPFHP
jgi:hypothetical protein